MNQTMLKVTACVPDVRISDAAYNTDAILQILKTYEGNGLLVFPELCLSGYTCGDLFYQEYLLKSCAEGLCRIAEESAAHPGMTVVVGLPVKRHDGIYDAAAVVSGGEICGIVPKCELLSHDGHTEGHIFMSGKKAIGSTVNICGMEVPFGIDLLFEDAENGIVLGAEIGSDVFSADRPSVHLSLAGAEVIAVPSALPAGAGRALKRRQYLQDASASIHGAYVYASAGTGESSTDMVFAGETVISRNGKILHANDFPQAYPYMCSEIIDLTVLRHDRMEDASFRGEDEGWYRRMPVSLKTLDHEADTVSTLTDKLKSEGFAPQRYPYIPEAEAERDERMQEILQIQAQGLATRLRKTGIRQAVLGISGGLDSTLALIVCAETRRLVPDLNILAITMPSEGNTSSATYDNATKLMHAFGVEVREIPIRKTVTSHLLDIRESAEYQGSSDTTYENAQARMRTMILMDAANETGGLVVGTGDLSELALGWCTYNGDHMSMYDVNADIPKTLVQELCRYYAEKHPGDIGDVLTAVTETPISPELTPNKEGQIAQKTEDHVGRYDVNDFIMYYLLRFGMSPAKLAVYVLCAYPELNIEDVKQALQRFFRRFWSQQFKRSCMPDGPKTGSTGLSPRGGWQMPSDASSAMFLKEIGELQ